MSSGKKETPARRQARPGRGSRHRKTTYNHKIAQSVGHAKHADLPRMQDAAEMVVAWDVADGVPLAEALKALQMAAALKMIIHCGADQTADVLRDLAQFIELHEGSQ